MFFFVFFILPHHSLSDLFGSGLNLDDIDPEAAPTPTEASDLRTPTNGTPNKFFSDANNFADGRANLPGKGLRIENLLVGLVHRFMFTRHRIR